MGELDVSGFQRVSPDQAPTDEVVYDDEGQAYICVRSGITEDATGTPLYLEELHERLDALTEKQRFVVECAFGMRDCYELSFREIGDLMGISHTSVRRLFWKAMNHLSQGGGSS